MTVITSSNRKSASNQNWQADFPIHLSRTADAIAKHCQELLRFRDDVLHGASQISIQPSGSWIVSYRKRDDEDEARAPLDLSPSAVADRILRRGLDLLCKRELYRPAQVVHQAFHLCQLRKISSGIVEAAGHDFEVEREPGLQLLAGPNPALSWNGFLRLDEIHRRQVDAELSTGVANVFRELIALNGGTPIVVRRDDEGRFTVEHSAGMITFEELLYEVGELARELIPQTGPAIEERSRILSDCCAELLAASTNLPAFQRILFLHSNIHIKLATLKEANGRRFELWCLLPQIGGESSSASLFLCTGSDEFVLEGATAGDCYQAGFYWFPPCVLIMELALRGDHIEVRNPVACRLPNAAEFLHPYVGDMYSAERFGGLWLGGRRHFESLLAETSIQARSLFAAANRDRSNSRPQLRDICLTGLATARQECSLEIAKASAESRPQLLLHCMYQLLHLLHEGLRTGHRSNFDSPRISMTKARMRFLVPPGHELAKQAIPFE